ncbi:MAG: hypothetical protein AAB685_02120 [Patescibacteria group bacterium]
MDDLAQAAIGFALAGKWNEAVSINKKILKSNSKDLDALNRLAHAYSELGDIIKAKKISKSVIKIDSLNTIAIKSLNKWRVTKSNSNFLGEETRMVHDFLEEPGKTKIVGLIRLGDKTLIASIDPGNEVALVCHPHKVSVTLASGKYIGSLPDDLANKLKKLVKGGNIYQTLVKSVEPDKVTVFIKEISRAEKFKDIPSFSLKDMADDEPVKENFW